MTISVCTLAHGREEHLANLVRGLARSRVLPDELVITVLQEKLYELPSAPFPVRQFVQESHGMPLAAARNTSGRAARSELLVFLDVDCIPSPDLVGDYARAAKLNDGVLMGEVAYLPKGATAEGLDFARFEELGQRHADRPGPPAEGVRACADYRCFWSLNFALSRAAFKTIGGFDERFTGYGGEDTDFGRMIVEAGLPLWWLKGAKAYHQHHPHHMPPVHHLDSVLANAMTFAEKWGEPTMQHWLRAFVLMGLLERTETGWRKLREPNAQDLALTRQQEDEPYASSSVVLEWLEEKAAAA